MTIGEKPKINNPIIRRLLRMFFAVFVLFLFFYIGLYTVFGSFQNGLAYLNGFRVIPLNVKSVYSGIRYGEKGEVSFTLRNLARKDVRIVGMNTSCDCLRAPKCPIILTKNSEQQIKFEYNAHRLDINKTMEYVVAIYVDIDMPPIVLRINVQVDG